MLIKAFDLAAFGWRIMNVGQQKKKKNKKNEIICNENESGENMWQILDSNTCGWSENGNESGLRRAL